MASTPDDPFLNTRRDFLKDSALAGIALGSLGQVFGAESGRRYSLALIGCGWWGRNILGGFGRRTHACGRVVRRGRADA